MLHDTTMIPICTVICDLHVLECLKTGRIMPNQLIDEDLQSAAFNHSAIPPDFKNTYFTHYLKVP